MNCLLPGAAIVVEKMINIRNVLKRMLFVHINPHHPNLGAASTLDSDDGRTVLGGFCWKNLQNGNCQGWQNLAGLFSGCPEQDWLK
jgi:hypothetical protein